MRNVTPNPEPTQAPLGIVTLVCGSAKRVPTGCPRKQATVALETWGKLSFLGQMLINPDPYSKSHVRGGSQIAVSDYAFAHQWRDDSFDRREFQCRCGAHFTFRDEQLAKAVRGAIENREKVVYLSRVA